MQVYAPLSLGIRLVSGVLAVVAGSTVLGGELGLFAMASNHAAGTQAAATAASVATQVVQRDARRAKRT